MRFAAGIDGGGTRTTVECRDLQGTVLCRAEFGPFNLNSIGQPRFAALLEELTAFLRQQGQCGALCIGAAGISNPMVSALTAQAMERAGIPQWRLVGDHEIALYGALSGGPGCILIAGTGSICCGRNAAGVSARAGGWGHLIDDGGSGYALGRDALSAVVRQWDGRGVSTLLSEWIPKTGTAQELIAWVYGGDKGRIASLAPLVEQAASAGDSVARQVLARNAEKLGELVCAVTGRLEMEQCELALLGGLLERQTRLRQVLTAYLAERQPGLSCIAPRQNAAAGAALMALDMERSRA